MYQVVDFLETHHRPLMVEGNNERRGRKHARTVRYAQTEYEDSDDESDEVDENDKKVKRKKRGRARKAGASQTLMSGKTESGKQTERYGYGQKQATGGDLERTLKALQDKIDSLERQLQQRGNGPNGTVQSSARPDVVCYTCSETGHYSRDCSQKQQGRRNGQFNNLRGQGTQGGYYRRGPSHPQNSVYNQTYQGVGPNSSQSLN